MLWWKFAKFLVSYLKALVSFLSNVASFFSAITQNSPILFLAQIFCTLFKRSPLKCKVLRFSSGRVKIYQIPHVIFEIASQFSLNVASIFSAVKQISPILFLAQRLCTFFKRSPLKCKFLRFLSARVKIGQSPLHFWKQKSVFLQMFASFFSAIKQNSFILFLPQRLCALFKKSPLQCKFLTLSSAQFKIPLILHVIFQSTGQFSFNVVSIFSAKTPVYFF